MKLNDPRYKDSMVSIPSPQIFLEGQHQQRFHYIQFFQLPLARGSHISSLVVALKVNMKGSLLIPSIDITIDMSYMSVSH